MSIRIHVVNTGSVSLTVPIYNRREEGKTDSVQIQPGGRPYLPPDWSVDPKYLQRTPDIREVTAE